jgi:hypothetical protein
MLEIVFILLQLGFVIYLAYFCIAFLSGAPFVPSTNPVASSMVKLAHIKKGQVIYDLGSGDGRILKLAATQGARAIGLEINPWLVLYTTIRYSMHRYPGSIRTLWRNFWKQDYADADVVFVYLLPWHMNKLAHKLKQELKPGAIVVTNSFIIPGWKLVREDSTNHVYVYSA